MDIPTALDSSLEASSLQDSGPEGESSDVPFVNGQLLVQFKAGTSSTAIQQLMQQQSATIAQTYYGLDNLVLVNLPWYSTAARQDTRHAGYVNMQTKFAATTGP